MTSAQANALATKLATLLQIDLHTSVLCADAPFVNHDERTLGDADFSWASNSACVRIALGQPEREVVSTILHELLHVATAEVRHVAHRSFEHLANTHEEAARDAVDDALERHVRKLERALLPAAMRLWREVKKEVEQ